IMEYVEGQTLAEVLSDQCELPVATACDYILQTALGLQHALDRGMVHRDIKPQNLMVVRGGHIKILDFGLARFVREQKPADGPAELAQVVAKMMAKDPDDRFQTPGAVAEALRPFTEAGSVVVHAARSAARQPDAGTSTPFYRKPVFALAVTAAVVLIGGGAW